MRGRNLLYVTYGVPHFPATGGFIRSFHLVRAAARSFHVTLLGVVEPDTTYDTSQVAAWCDAVYTVPAPEAARDSQWAAPEIPHSVLWRFDSRPLKAAARDLLYGKDVDLLVAEHTEIAWALREEAARMQSIADLQNALSVYQQRTWEMDGLDTTAIAQVEALERDILSAYTATNAVSTTDAAALQRLDPAAKVQVVPNGVDSHYFDVPREPEPYRLVFTGALWYRPNVDAMTYFVREILPLVRDVRPEATLWIVGARPNEQVRALAGSGVEIVADVPDVRPYLARAAAAVVPLQLGAGTRLKVLEAAAAGVPIVTTGIGMEGLDLTPGHDVLVADTAALFAGHILTLLERVDIAGRLGAAAQRAVRERYDWSRIGTTWERLVHEQHAFAR